MGETVEIVVGLCVLVAVFLLTRQFHSWRFSRAYTFIIKDLKKRGAMSTETAVHLPYAKKSMLRMGTRDYRPKALEHLAMREIVGMAADDRYYLIFVPEGF